MVGMHSKIVTCARAQHLQHQTAMQSPQQLPGMLYLWRIAVLVGRCTNVVTGIRIVNTDRGPNSMSTIIVKDDRLQKTQQLPQ
jgi:hypothetical protein